MTTERFTFQRACVAMTEGIVLNVGANEDPAGLKQSYGDRVINCDIEATDSYLDRPNKVDVLFDCTKPWPFDDNYAELALLGDIIEHLYWDEAAAALDEAYRVAEKLCITVPNDNRFETDEQGVLEKNGYRTHCFVWTEENLRELLDKTGWDVVDWQTVDYYFVPEGYFIFAERRKEDDLEVSIPISISSSASATSTYITYGGVSASNHDTAKISLNFPGT
jgi:predicted SAM-dependent methyltransferase